MIRTIEEIKKLGAERLISITGMEKSLYYHLEKEGRVLGLCIDVPDDETVESLVGLFANAALFEAEVTELFGIRFNGNPMSGMRLFQPEPGAGVEEFPMLGRKKGEG